MALVLALQACTDPVERPAPVSASIDADAIVRQNTAVVEITIEGQRSERSGDSKVWEQFKEQVFRPERDETWPWRYTLTADESMFERYSLVAIARDARRAVLGRVQVIRDLADARRSGLRGHFDTACFRREECDDGYTCAGGDCVDATKKSALPAADGGMPSEPTEAGSIEMPDKLKNGIAIPGGSCKTGQRACTDHGSRTPLECVDGTWKTQPDCPETERCTTVGDALGTCQAITAECANRTANVPFCDGEAMRVCTDLVAIETRSCSENEQCFSTQDGAAECRCKPGFTMEGGRCSRPSKCGANNGGCDTLTTCTSEGDKRVCGACPSGQYTGTGDRGCSPLLLDLMLSSGTLEPALASNVNEYRVHVPLVGQRVTFTPSVPANTKVSLNGEPLDERGTWTSPVLPFSETAVKLEITSEFGVTSQYVFTLERTAEQIGYIKAVNAGELNQFGTAVAVSGDTVVATAWFDDSAATGINGDPNNTGADNSGAAYVYVRDGTEWKLQAFVKPSDTMAYDFFGSAVVIQGDLLVVGAIHEGIFSSESSSDRPGAAYVYERKAGEWKQTQRIAGSTQNSADLFGWSLAMNGDTLIVGAPRDSSSATQSGAVYVYQRNGSTFTEVQKLKATKPSANGAFGMSLSLDGERLLVGSPSGGGPASAEVLVREDGKWKNSQVLPLPMGADKSFGYGVAMRGNRLAVSAPRPSAYPGSLTPTDPGEVYLYELDGSTWKQTTVLRAPHTTKTNWFGLSLLFTNDGGLIVASPGNKSADRGVHADPERGEAQYAGAIHLFSPTANGWVESAFIKGDNTTDDDWFAYSMAVDGDLIVAGSLFENRTDTSIKAGAVYVFH